MNGPDHYREAERLLAQAARWENDVNCDLSSYKGIDSARRAAQVHATLALVAATADAVPDDDGAHWVGKGALP